MWAIEVARNSQVRAIAHIKTRKAGLKYMRGMNYVQKFYLSMLTGCELDGSFSPGLSAKRGYMLMTYNEFRYAIGHMSDREADNLIKAGEFYKGKKTIVAADVDINGRLTLIPIR